jgi:hypothetical protein
MAPNRNGGSFGEELLNHAALTKPRCGDGACWYWSAVISQRARRIAGGSRLALGMQDR